MAAENNAELDARSIVTTRLIDAPRELVFDAFTNPEHLARWWGPIGFTTTTHSFDLRPGGEWRLTMYGPDGRDYENHIVYDEVVRPERLVYTHGGDGGSVAFKSTIAFEEIGGKTRLTMRGVFPTKQERDRVAETYGAVEGAEQTLGRLDEFLSDTMFTISRSFDAPRALVWKVFSHAEHLAKWWGPNGMESVGSTLDFRPGGLFHYGMKAPNGAQMWGKFVYRDIAPMERIVFVNTFSDAAGNTTRAPFAPDWPLEVLNVLTFVEANGKTTLTLRGGPINATAAERDKFKAFHNSMQQGFGGTFAQLDAYLLEISGKAPRELTLTRVLNAPRALVFKAWTDPKMLAAWWGPKGVHQSALRSGCQAGRRDPYRYARAGRHRLSDGRALRGGRRAGAACFQVRRLGQKRQNHLHGAEHGDFRGKRRQDDSYDACPRGRDFRRHRRASSRLA